MRARLLPVLVLALAACAPLGTGGSDDDDRDGGDDAASDAGPGSGAPCTFNSDCPDAERCACTEADGCACETGARGTGQSGVDTCVDGNDCETSLCVEGPGTDFICSGPCVDDSDCTGQLPVCADITFVGRICIRQSGP